MCIVEKEEGKCYEMRRRREEEEEEGRRGKRRWNEEEEEGKWIKGTVNYLSVP